MFNTTNNSVTTNSTKELSGIIDGGSTMRTFFGLVAGLSVVSNALLCIVMLRRRAMLSKTYNILIFNLAITDMLTGTTLILMIIIAIPSFKLYQVTKRAFDFSHELEARQCLIDNYNFGIEIAEALIWIRVVILLCRLSYHRIFIVYRHMNHYIPLIY